MRPSCECPAAPISPAGERRICTPPVLEVGRESGLKSPGRCGTVGTGGVGPAGCSWRSCSLQDWPAAGETAVSGTDRLLLERLQSPGPADCWRDCSLQDRPAAGETAVSGTDRLLERLQSPGPAPGGLGLADWSTETGRLLRRGAGGLVPERRAARIRSAQTPGEGGSGAASSRPPPVRDVALPAVTSPDRRPVGRIQLQRRGSDR